MAAMIPQRPIEELLKLTSYKELSSPEISALIEWNDSEVMKIEQSVNELSAKTITSRNTDYIEEAFKTRGQLVVTSKSVSKIKMALIPPEKELSAVSLEEREKKETRTALCEGIRGRIDSLQEEIGSKIEEYCYKFPNEKTTVLKKMLLVAGASAIAKDVALWFTHGNTKIGWTVYGGALVASIAAVEKEKLQPIWKRLGHTVCFRAKDVFSALANRKGAVVDLSRDRRFGTHGWSQDYYLP